MKKLLLFCHFSLFAFLILGCGTTQSSSGLMIGNNARIIPQGVPKRIGVAKFTGDYPINIQSTDQFSVGLIELGFDVVERHHLEAIINELALQNSGFISEQTRKKLGEQLGLEGIFVGSVTGEVSPMWIDTHLNIKFVDIESGKIIWAATANDPRVLTVSTDVKTSIFHTTKKALKMFRSDLTKL